MVLLFYSRSLLLSKDKEGWMLLQQRSSEPSKLKIADSKTKASIYTTSKDAARESPVTKVCVYDKIYSMIVFG